MKIPVNKLTNERTKRKPKHHVCRLVSTEHTPQIRWVVAMTKYNKKKSSIETLNLLFRAICIRWHKISAHVQLSASDSRQLYIR